MFYIFWMLRTSAFRICKTLRVDLEVFVGESLLNGSARYRRFCFFDDITHACSGGSHGQILWDRPLVFYIFWKLTPLAFRICKTLGVVLELFGHESQRQVIFCSTKAPNAGHFAISRYRSCLFRRLWPPNTSRSTPSVLHILKAEVLSFQNM